MLPPAESEARNEWETLKRNERAENKILEILIEKMIGLEDVKQHFLRIMAKINTAKRQGVDLKYERFDLVILGNSGVGKSTVAVAYAWFLVTLGMVAMPQGKPIDIDCSKMVALDSVKAVATQIEEAKTAGGGVFVVDNVHLLTQDSNMVTAGVGVQVLDTIISNLGAGDETGKVVFILAGERSVLDGHPTLSTKIPSKMIIEDYKDWELLEMLKFCINTTYKEKMEVEGNAYTGDDDLYLRIAIRRISRTRGSKNFNNAHAIDTLFERIRERQGERLNKMKRQGLEPNDFWLSKEDIIGPNPAEAIQLSDAWTKLQGFIGLESVKQNVRSLIDMIETNYRRELQEKPPLEVSLNRVFLGSPGTGKTSVAKLYGRILADLGMLSNGDVVVKNPADFMGDYLGQSENKAKGILNSAIGKVLVIDEAYMLYPGYNGQTVTDADIYKVAVVDTLVAEVQSTPGEDRCVLLLGYEEEMRRMFQNVNPGLARRFAIEEAFQFEDFTDAELRQILDKKLSEQHLHATDAAKAVASEVLSRAKMRPNFGNGGEVENMISQAKVRYQQRISKVPPAQRPEDVIFEPVDFDPNFARGATAALNCRTLFADVVGCEEIIAKLEGYQQIAANAKAAGIELHELIPTNFLFKGPPGTGKTMTARKMGEVYYQMGFLSSARVKECSSTDLIGQALGQTGPKTQKLVESARGQVLFIDEAYRLAEGEYAKEALNELVDILTKPDYLGKIVVILAGYDADINRLLSINSGLGSRFPEEIRFSNMTPDHCVQVLLKDLESKKVKADFLRDGSCAPYREICGLLKILGGLPGWGNARDVKTLAKTMVGVVYRNPKAGAVPTLQPDEAVECVRKLLSEREARRNVVA
ncbi:ATPases of the AAA+ class [Sphaerosporella brunnea]|uniref:ATPases of the AAA+ class n=1 Tax=Sphaerosporella brunnea TaxID=1250544 RepID=A0A5J5EL95_9PEZI|nr:ATPases of the AAA+ class [Sphaerosporella brunnea]